MSRVITSNKFNVPAHQMSSEWYPVKTESIIIPSSSNPVLGSFFTIDYRELSTMVHDLTLQYNFTSLTGTTVTNFVPAYFFAQRIEYVQNGKVISTNYATEQFVLNQLFNPDETRKLLNMSSGDYSSTAQRVALAATSNSYYLNVFNYIKMSGGIPVIDVNHTIQLRIYLDNLTNITSPAGAPVATLTSVNLIAKITRLRTQEVELKKRELMDRPQHFKFNEPRSMFPTIPVGVTSTNIVLQGISGRISMLFFVMRAVGATTNGNYFAFNPLVSYNILDSSSTNISGGQAISNSEALGVLSRDWISSSYLSEQALSQVNNNANVYFYSFCTDPKSTICNGISTGHWNFTGNEQLQLNFASALGSAYNLEIYAYNNAVVEISKNGVDKKDFI